MYEKIIFYEVKKIEIILFNGIERKKIHMEKYLIEELRKYGYDRIATVKESNENNKKWNISFLELNTQNIIKKGDIIKGKLFIQYVSKSFKVSDKLSAAQPLMDSPHIQAIVKVVKKINSDSLLVKSTISDTEILVEFENDIDYDKNDIVFLGICKSKY